MRKLLRRPSPAMVVASLALLVALGGTSMAAATQLARNSVGTPQLKDAAVSNPKIKNNAVNSAKVANKSLLRSDFAPGQLPAGPTGPQGPAGPAGAAGAAGPAGVIGAITVRTNVGRRSMAELRRTGVQQLSRYAAVRRRTSEPSRPGTSWSTTQRARAHDRRDRAAAQRAESGDRLPRGRAERQRKRQHVHGARSLLHAVIYS